RPGSALPLVLHPVDGRERSFRALALGQRQGNAHGDPPIVVALRPDLAAMRFDEATRDCQPDSGTDWPVSCLNAIEAIEDTLLFARRQTDALIAHRDLRVVRADPQRER